MKAWWQGLSAREKTLVGWTGVLLAGFLFWLLLWRPLLAANEAAIARADSLQRELGWIHAAAAEIARLEGSGAGSRASRGNQSLLALVESSARGAGMENAFRRGEPAAPGQVRVWLENAAFDPLVRWLQVLDERYGVTASEASIDRAGVPGLVNVRLTLVEPGELP